jgi:anti-sigma regulatory factor (Ser/Thr protein kinase)
MTGSNGSGDMLVLELNGGDEAAGAARRAFRAGDGALPAPVRQDVLLLMTEVVTNAVRHAGVGPEGLLRVELRWSPRQVRVEVLDPGPGFTPHIAPVWREGGWGLYLVDRIADRWGVTFLGSGTCVWFEIEFGD